MSLVIWLKNCPGENRGNFIFLCLFILFFAVGCADASMQEPEKDKEKVEGVDYFLPHIDLSHWKVTLPIGDPTEVEPPEILEYATSSVLRPYMYNDSTDGSLVFYAYPGATTTNTSYSRTELREQLEPGSNSTNWTFVQGGIMKGTLSVPEITKDGSGKYHKVIIMQIHGRLSNEQRDLIGASDNDAPPMLKIYWENEKVKVITKQLVDVNATDLEILKKDAWKDAPSHTFNTLVGKGKFTLEVQASDGKLKIILNDAESVTYDDIHIQRWSVFENYFKAGDYFQTLDAGAQAKVKYYKLEVSH